MQFWLKFDMCASIHHQLLKLTEDCRLVTVSTDLTRNSCGMADITSRIRPSISSNFVGLVEYTSSFNQPQEKKSQGVMSRTIHLPGNWAFSHSRKTMAKCGRAPSCMKMEASIFSQVLKTGQISFLSIVRYLSTFTVSRKMKGPTIGSYFSITLVICFLQCIYRHVFRLNLADIKLDFVVALSNCVGIILLHSLTDFLKPTK